MYDRRKPPAPPKDAYINYKDVDTLSRFMTPQGKLQPRRKIGGDAKLQHRIREAVQRARFMGLLPYGS